MKFNPRTIRTSDLLAYCRDVAGLIEVLENFGDCKRDPRSAAVRHDNESALIAAWAAIGHELDRRIPIPP